MIDNMNADEIYSTLSIAWPNECLSEKLVYHILGERRRAVIFSVP